MILILVILLIVLVVGGGWGYSRGSYAPFGGLLGLLLIVVLILWLTGNLSLR